MIPLGDIITDPVSIKSVEASPTDTYTTHKFNIPSTEPSVIPQSLEQLIQPVK